ncbi:MAG: hypothetical protein VKP62_09035 [Candidatus Sericytochromatia bacterium]|nr:hypothetical protein [Candidatus Sericytochromatia bacterium]
MALVGQPVPVEMVELRNWLALVFSEAARGLPWPQVLALKTIEHALALGMIGGVLSSAWALESSAGRGVDPMAVARVRRAFESLAFGSLGKDLGPGLAALLGLTGRERPN